MGVGIWSMISRPDARFHIPFRLIPVGRGCSVGAVAAYALALVVVTAEVGLHALAGRLMQGPAIAGRHYIGMAALTPRDDALHIGVVVSVGLPRRLVLG